MPFASDRQRRYLFAAAARGEIDPSVLQAYRDESPRGVKLPERARDVLAPPAAVRRAFARGLALYDRGLGGKGLRPETVAWARKLARGVNVNEAKARQMRAWFARHGVPRDYAAARRRPESPAAVAWLLWGGDPRVPYAARGWRDPVHAWLTGALAYFDARSGRGAAQRRRRGAPGAKRNRVGADVAMPSVDVQVNDAEHGHYYARLSPVGCEVFVLDGGAWQKRSACRWNFWANRLEAPAGEVPPRVARALSHALLAASPDLRQRATPYAEMVEAAFTLDAGDRGVPADLSRSGLLAVSSAAAAQCELLPLPGQKARPARGMLHRAVATAALRETCGDTLGYVTPGSDCDKALRAMGTGSIRRRCEAKVPECPHKVSPGLLAEWRGGAMPPVGPYDLDTAHAPGSDPCCVYHPLQQERLALRTLLAREHPEVRHESAAWWEIVRDAEARHPQSAAWARCDKAMQRAAGSLVVSAEGRGAEGLMVALKGFYEAARRDETYAARANYAVLQRELGASLPAYDDLAAVDSAFFDIAHRAAHDVGNAGYVKWVHDAMQRQGITPHHEPARAKPPAKGRARARAAA